MSARFQKFDHYYLCESPSAHTRLHHYPAGFDYLAKMARESAGSALRSLTKDFLSVLEKDAGAIYITVPFGCPEGVEIEDLWWSLFLYREDPTLSDDKLLKDVSTVGPTNEAFREQVVLGNAWIITEQGLEPPGYVPQPLDEDEFVVEKVWYRHVRPDHDEDHTWTVLNDMIPRFRFLVDAPPPELASWEAKLEFSAAHIRCVALQIFDYSGYLVWFPTASK